MRTRVVVGFILVFTLVVAGQAFAQNVEGGIKGGVNFSTVSGDFGIGVSKTNRISGVGGAFGTFLLTDRVGVQIEALYSMEGSKATVATLGTNVESTVQIDYIRIPLLLRLGARPGVQRSGYFLVGPALGFIAAAKQTFPGRADQDLKDQLKSSEFAVVVGAGMTFSHYLFEIRYTAGLTDINNQSSSGTNKSQTFSVMGGIRF